MAKTVTDPKVGQVVYQAYTPQNPGVIEELLPDQTNHRFRFVCKMVRVRWLRPEKVSAEQDIVGLCDFDALIEDHEKKLSGHLQRKAELLRR